MHALGIARRALVALLSLVAATTPRAAAGASYVGLYADAEGTKSYASVPPSSAKTLYVIAKVDGSLSGGLIGAEFRIEFGNAAGWIASYAAPATANLVSGDPVDRDPGANACGGIALAFPICQVPLNGMVSLGTLSLFNASGSSTTLRVKRHSKPSRADYPCPLFTLCDDPTFSKLCMSAGEAASCSTLSIPKVRRIATEDPAVFELGLNTETASTPVPPESTFTDTLTIRSSNELWVMGIPISGPTVSGHFDGAHLSVGGVVIRQIPPPEESDEQLQRYTRIPRVVALQEGGMTIRQAVKIYRSEFNALIPEIFAAYRLGGQAAMRHVLESSPLIESFSAVSGGTASVKYRGYGAPMVVQYGQPLPRSKTTPRTIAASLLTSIRHTVQWPGPHLVMVDGTSISSFGILDMDAARAQLEYVHRTGTTDGLPPGPLTKQSDAFRTILSAQKAGRGK